MQCLQSAYRLCSNNFPVEKDAIPVDRDGKGVSTVDSKDDFFSRISSEPTEDQIILLAWCVDGNA